MTTVLITGAGGAATPDLIKHLKQFYKVVAVDCDPLAAGFEFADASATVPRGDEIEFPMVIAGLCALYNVDIIVPLVDEELMPIHGNVKTPILAPTLEFTAMCMDKLSLARELDSHGFYIPNYVAPPFIVKPRTGHGSRGVQIFKDDMMAQKYIEGTEFTVSVVVNQNNHVRAIVPKQTINKQGITFRAITEKNDEIDAVCRQIVQEFEPCGPFNVQLVFSRGTPFIFEINPRFSGTCMLTTTAGCSEVHGLIEEKLGRPYQWGEWREGVEFIRYYTSMCKHSE